jgi:hypothetical protein
MMDEDSGIGSINLLSTERGGNSQFDANLMNDRQIFITRTTISKYDHQYINNFNLYNCN